MILTKENIKQVVQDYFKDKPVKKCLFRSYARGQANTDKKVDLVEAHLFFPRIKKQAENEKLILYKR